ncbi:MAG TPA: pre-peptidase C-terminal domain-containing protein [Sedimentisphaerales bacterium]|nr:pre-peptidase C-terminal domain-containing protein [Sedimentisphaerales bacterium]
MESLNIRNAKSLAILVALLGMLATTAFAQTSLTNGVPVTGISGAAGSERFYRIEVPAGQDELEISTSEGTGDVDLYVRRGSQPTTTSYDYRPYKIGNNETVTVANPAAGTWYIMLKGYNAYANVRLLAEYSAATAITPMANGVLVTGLAGAAAGELYFSIQVPAGQTKLEIIMSGGTGDADLYVKRGALPTTSSYDYRPYLFGNEESVSVNNPAAATWYIMVRGYNAFAGVSLLAGYGGVTGTLLENGVAVTNLSGVKHDEKLYRIEVPAGQTSLEIVVSGGTGDADLYVKYGSRPTTVDYDYRPALPDNEETVSVNNPVAGTWYIVLRGYAAYTGVSLKAAYSDVLLLQDGVPVRNLAGALNSVTYFRIVVPAGQDTLLFSMSGGTGNADLYIKKGSKPTTSSWDYRPIQPTNTESISIGGTTVPGTWYVMIRGTAAFSGVTLLADYSVSNVVVTLVNGVPVNDISAGQGGAKYYKIEVPASQTKLEIAISGGTGDADLYVRRGSLPTTAEYDHRPYLPGNSESVTVNNPTAGTWFIMIRAYQAFSGLTLLATYGGGAVPEEVITLQNGVTVTGITGAAGSEKFYKITVPASQSKLEIVMAGGTGDADLYVRRGSKPTTTEWDYRPFLIGNNETVTIDDPLAATYFIMLKGYVAYASVTLKATHTAAPDPITTLQNGVAVTGLSGASGSEKFYKIDIPAGQDLLTIATSGGTGDVDLYVRKGSKPTLVSYDYRPYLIGNNETVEVPNPAAATWYIMLRGYQTYANVTLVATYSVTIVGNNFAQDANAVALWKFESGKLTLDSLGTNTLENHGAVANASVKQEGESSAQFRASEFDYMSIPDANLAAGFPLKSGTTNRNISLCTWFRMDSLPTWYRYVGLFTKFNEQLAKRSFAVSVARDGGGQVNLWLEIGHDSGKTATWIPFTDTGIVAGNWYHVGVTYRDSDRSYRIRLWDGVSSFEKTGTVVKSISVTDAAVFVGNVPGLNWSFDGQIDELVVFKDILTASEIDRIRDGIYGK